jgi:competence protein ComEC
MLIATQETANAHNIRFYVIETGDEYSNANNNSVLTKLDYNNVEFLFTGDMEADVEGLILSKDIQADILKVGHHGSRTSTSEDFLNKVKPAAAVISVGEGNTYGHPHEETLHRLTEHGVDIYMTTAGNIICTTDGKSYSFNTQPVNNPAPNLPITGAGQYVGSIKSNRFHNPSCKYAKSILPINRIWFKTREEALSQEYYPCGACKP